MYKVLGILFISVAGVIAYLTLQIEEGSKGSKGFLFLKKDTCAQLTPAEQLSKLISDDFMELRKSNQLPTAWGSIATIEYRMNSELAKALLGKNHRPQFQRIKDGTTYLELEVMDLPDENDPGIIIQASLFDIRSKNKLFEIGRTYNMSQLNNEKPATETAPPKKKAPPPPSKQPSNAQPTTFKEI